MACERGLVAATVYVRPWRVVAAYHLADTTTLLYILLANLPSLGALLSGALVTYTMPRGGKVRKVRAFAGVLAVGMVLALTMAIPEAMLDEVISIVGPTAHSLPYFHRYGRWLPNLAYELHSTHESLSCQLQAGGTLTKCSSSPHVYLVTGNTKGWIRDIETFRELGFWDCVEIVPCQYLHNLPDGETIPPDSGVPPQP